MSIKRGILAPKLRVGGDSYSPEVALQYGPAAINQMNSQMRGQVDQSKPKSRGSFFGRLPDRDKSPTDFMHRRTKSSGLFQRSPAQTA